MKQVIRVFVCICLVLCLALPCLAEQLDAEVTVSQMRMDGAEGSYVACPVFAGGADGAVTAAINAGIQADARIMEYVTLLGQIEPGSTGLQMDYEMTPENAATPVLSLVFSARGKMLAGRPSQVYYPMVIDMETGSRVAIDAIFTDMDAAQLAIETYVEEEVAPLLSTHLENSELLPVPLDQFGLDEIGITFYYDIKQLSFLSGFSGAVTIPYHELEEHLNLAEGSVLARMGLAQAMLDTHEETAGNIAMAAKDGRLGTLPGVVSMLLDEAVDVFRSTTDAGFYPGGAYYEMEDSRLRDALLITDENETHVTGIYSKRVSLWGIRTGQTTRDVWQAVLGEPNFSMEMGESDSQQYLLCPGDSDYYDFGDYTLQLHADVNGVLYAAVLSN